MNKSRIAQTLRNLSVNPSLESDVDANIETGPAGEGTVKENLEEAQTTQADAEIGDAEGENLTVKTVEVGEGCEVETAETEVTDSEGTVSQEGVKDVIGFVTSKQKRLEWSIKQEPAQIKEAQDEIDKLKAKKKEAQAAGRTSTVQKLDAEIAEWEEEIVDIKDNVKAFKEELEKVLAKKKAKVSQESEGSDVDADLTTGDGEQIVKAEAEAVDETPADGAGAPGEDKDLTVKIVEVGERSDLESAETVSTEGLTGLAIGAVAGFFLLPILGGAILGAVGGHLVQSYLQKRARLAEMQATALKAIAAGDQKTADKTKADFEKLSEEVKTLQEQIEKKAKEKKVSTESVDDAAAAAAAFAEGAAGAAEAAAAASGESSEAAADVAEVVEETVAEVAEEAGEAAADAVEDVETAEEVEAIEEGSTEIEELDGDIAEIEGHAEKYEQAAATMESLIDALRDAQQTGGLSAQSARFFTIGFESIGVNLIGKPFENERGETALPSLESFGGSMRRDQATQVSMEAAEGWFQKIWEVLKKTFQQIKEWVIKFIKAIFDQGERYYQRADKIIAAVSKGGRNASAKSAKIKLGKVGSKIAIGSEIQISHLDDLVKIAQEAGVRSEAASELIGKVKVNLSKVSGTMNDQEMTGDDFINILGMAMLQTNGDLRTAVFSEPYKSGGLEGFGTKTLPGNVKMAVIEPSSEDTTLRKLLVLTRGWRIVTTRDPNAPEEGDFEANTLGLNDVRRVAESVKKIVEASRKAKNDLKVEGFDITNVPAASDLSEQQAKDFRKYTGAVAKSVSTASASIGQLLKYAVGTSGYYLDYAAASLKQYQIQIDVTGAAAPKALAAPAA